MKHYFKGTINNLRYIGKSNLPIINTALSICYISDEDLNKILSKKYLVSYEDGEFVYEDNVVYHTFSVEQNEKLTEIANVLKVKQAKEAMGLSVTSEEDQLDTLRIEYDAL